MAAATEAASPEAAGADAEIEKSIGFATRAVRVASGLVKVHLEFAKREADRDKQRVISGVVTAIVGGILLALALVLLDVFAVVLVHAETPLALHWAILSVAGGNVLLGGLLVLVGSRSLKKPVMPETRDLVQKTFAAMTDG